MSDITVYWVFILAAPGAIWGVAYILFLVAVRDDHHPEIFLCRCRACSLRREPAIRIADKILEDARAAQKEWMP